MAVHTIGPDDVAAHFTLTPNEIDQVTFTYRDATVEIVTRDGGGDVWYTLDGRDPVIGGANCYVVPAGVVGSDVRQSRRTVAAQVRLLSDTAVAVTVQRAS